MSKRHQEQFDKRWLYAVALSGITFAVSLVNARMDPGIFTVTIAIGLAVVFLMFTLIQVPAELGILNQKLCRLIGHEWDLEPPWSGKELRSKPQCQACGYQPNDIVITGKHEGDHRV